MIRSLRAVPRRGASAILIILLCGLFVAAIWVWATATLRSVAEKAEADARTDTAALVRVIDAQAISIFRRDEQVLRLLRLNLERDSNSTVLDDIGQILAGRRLQNGILFVIV